MILTEFVLAGCPYCRRAQEILEELKREEPRYAGIDIEVIDEGLHPDIADRYDYYRVPSFFCGTEKLYEADPARSRAEARELLKRMLDGIPAEN